MVEWEFDSEAHQSLTLQRKTQRTKHMSTECYSRRGVLLHMKLEVIKFILEAK